MVILNNSFFSDEDDDEDFFFDDGEEQQYNDDLQLLDSLLNDDDATDVDDEFDSLRKCIIFRHCLLSHNNLFYIFVGFFFVIIKIIVANVDGMVKN